VGGVQSAVVGSVVTAAGLDRWSLWLLLGDGRRRIALYWVRGVWSAVLGVVVTAADVDLWSLWLVWVDGSRRVTSYWGGWGTAH
jgi:hypothetical protein